MWGLTLANFEPTVVGPHTHIGCLSWFSVHCVNFLLLCNSSEKNICQNKPFFFFWVVYSYGEKRGQYWVTPKSTFFVEIKELIIAFQSFLFYKISYFKAEFIVFFWQERVIFTPAKTTTIANQLQLLGIKQRDTG